MVVTAEQVSQSFGEQIRRYRRQCADPMRGGLLTQERLGELIGVQMNDAGYTGAAISEWERDKSKIHADDRLVLLALTTVFVECGGISSVREVDELLAAGNYRRLDAAERAQVFGRDEADETAVTTSSASPGNDATATSVSRIRAKQLVLLEKVQRFWVEGVLEKSVQGAPLIDLKQTYRMEAIDHPWDDLLGPALIGGAEEETAGWAIEDVFERADHALLILGDPGSGKTTTLITLARALIEQARQDNRRPIPVILNLSSWAQMGLNLDGWVVEELTAKYQIPRRYGRKWLAANDLVLLLDGLDALPLPARRVCVEAINAFRGSHGLTGLAVGCRDTEYLELGTKLDVCGAVALRPLDDEQIEAYLALGGEDLAELDEALSDAPALAEMARNPLMLSLMTAVFASGTGESDEGEELATGSESQELILDAYVHNMFDRRAAHVNYTQEKTLDWLGWLARRMNDHNQSIFLIEQIQPSWLPNRRQRLTYLALAGVITGTAGGIIMWLLWRLLRYTLPQLPAATSEFIAGFLGITQTAAEPVTIILGNLLLGLLLAGTLAFLFERRRGQPSDQDAVRRWRRLQTLLVGLETGAATALFVALFSDPLIALAWGVAEGFMYGASVRYIFGWSYATEVRTVERLGWSWPHAGTGVLVGLLLGIVAEVIETMLYGYNGASRTLSTLMLAGFVLGGMRGRSTQVKIRPNQGVWLSLRNAVIAAVVLSVTLAALSWIIRDVAYAWQIGVLAAVIAVAIMGGSVFIKHFLIKAMLTLQGLMPWQQARFLDHAAQLVLLRKVGNGYIFVHGLLQAHFAQSH